MKKNMGPADRIIRISVAVIIAILYFEGLISGTTALILGVVAAIFLLTSFISFCPIYTIFGLSTRKKNNI